MNWLFVITLILCCKQFSCLYEDQIGKFDWKQSYIGKVKDAKIDFKAKTKRAFVTTDKNTLACLSLKSGSITWRKVLSDQIKLMALMLTDIVTVSGDGPYTVQIWNANTGALVTDWFLPISGPVDFVVNDQKLSVIRLKDFTVDITSYVLRSGSTTEPYKTVSFAWFKPEFGYVIKDNTLFHVSPNGKLYVFNLDSSAPTTFDLPTQGDPVRLEQVPGDLRAIRIVYAKGPPVTVLIRSEGIEVIKDTPVEGSLGIHSINNNYIVVSLTENEGVYMIAAKNHAGQPVPESTGRVGHTFPLDSADILDLVCLEERMSCYLLTLGHDHALALVAPGRVLWLREEGLADIVTVEMVSLPVSDTEVAIEMEFNNKEGGLLDMFLRRIASQVSQLQTFLGLSDHDGDSSATLVRDQFGLHKMIVAVTSISKVFGIDSVSGEIVWQYRVEAVTPLVDPVGVPFYLQRTARHHPYPPVATLIFTSQKTGNSVLFVFNPINGQPLEGGLLDVGSRVLQAMMLPSNDDHFIKGLILLSELGTVHVFPTSSKPVALELAPSLYLFTADRRTNRLTGYSLGASTDKEIMVTETWSAQLTGELVAIASKDPNEKVHSQGRVMADRSVLYKYLNPNLVAFATFTEDPVHKGVLNIYLIDVVRGSIKSSLTHKRVTKSIHLVHSENWLVYSFYNDKYRRTELVTLEMYEGKTQNNSEEFSSLTYKVEPFIDKQAYIFPHHITAMKETVTEKGITSRHLLVGVESGSVYELGWGLLDHRWSGIEEGQVPYMPQLPLPTEAMISYNLTVSQIRGIITSPSSLESTCLVFTYGQDIFYTRVTPSKTFDILKDDFDYWLISVVLIALTTSAWLTKRLSSRKQLRNAWK